MLLRTGDREPLLSYILACHFGGESKFSQTDPVDLIDLIFRHRNLGLWLRELYKVCGHWIFILGFFFNFANGGASIISWGFHDFQNIEVLY